MKILITGAQGQVGSELAKQAIKKKFQVFPPTHAQLDITQTQQISDALANCTPDVVINAAAYTAVDAAENNAKLAFTVNSEGPGLLAQICARQNIPLIHLSTDYIFSGNQTIPYKEEDIANPINTYGQSKLAGETAIREHWDRHLILRVSGIFSSQGNNFVKTILRLAQEKDQLSIVHDQMTCPTSAVDICQAILFLCENLKANLWGTYHYCSIEPTSWYHFAEAILLHATNYKTLKTKKLLPVASHDYPTRAKRPAYSVLNCSKLKSQWNLDQSSWQTGLIETVRELMR